MQERPWAEMPTNISVELDNMSENPLIDAVFLASSNPTFKDREGNWTNVYGDRSVGVFLIRIMTMFILAASMKTAHLFRHRIS